MPYHRPLDEPDAPRGKPCAHLRSKGMYVTGQLDPAEVGHSDGYCWCNQTQQQIGPDRELVDRAACQEGRGCFETIL